MSGNAVIDCIFWFFAIVGFLFLICDLWQYFTESRNMPSYFCIIIPSYELLPAPHKSLQNLAERIYHNNPDGQYDIIIADDGRDAALSRELEYISSVNENIFIASTGEISDYIKSDFA